MSLMKACKNRRKGAGNSNPNKRHAFPDIDQNALDESLDLYVRTVGQTESFNLYSYKTLQAQMAESPQSFYKLHGLLDALIGVERSGCIKYKYLKSALSTLQRRLIWHRHAQQVGGQMQRGPAWPSCRLPLGPLEALEAIHQKHVCMVQNDQELG